MADTNSSAAPGKARSSIVDMHIPLVTIAVLLVHSAIVFLWAGDVSARVGMIERRLAEDSGLKERVARVEEQNAAIKQILERVERKLDTYNGPSGRHP